MSALRAAPSWSVLVAAAACAACSAGASTRPATAPAAQSTLPAAQAMAAAAAASAAATTAAVATTAAAAPERAADLAAFDAVWTTIRDQHWDPTLGGIDWNGVRAELRPRVEQAQSAAQARAVIQEMLQRLGQSHFALLPKDAVEVLRPAAATGDTALDAAPAGEGTAGLDVRIAGDVVLVTAVAEGSSGWDAGIRPGFELLRIGTGDVAALLPRLRVAAGHGIEAPFHVLRALQQRLQGPVGGQLSVALRDGEGHLTEHRLTLAAPPGEIVAFGNLPPMRVWLTSGWARPPRADGTGGIGVIAFNAFLDPVRLMQQFADAVRTFQRADGIVLDLRGNAGGIGAMAMGMAGFFVAARDRYLGTMITRQTRLRFVVNPRPPVYAGPLAVLLDGMTASTGEILAAGLQDLERARIFGQRSAGMALPSLLTVLPNGDGFQYAFASYETAKGTVLEGSGVTPDAVVPLTRERMLAEVDPVLGAAVAWITAAAATPRSPLPGSGPPR